MNAISALAPSPLQQVVDQAAILNLFVTPGSNENDHNAQRASRSWVHDLQIEMKTPINGENVKAVNRLGERLGQLTCRIVPIPYRYKSLPNREPPSIVLDRSVSQRFELQECTFSFGTAGSFDCFGTGRTYPIILGGKPRLAATAVAEITNTTGGFLGLPGNVTFCGVLSNDKTFWGHVIVRLVDQHASLRIRRLQDHTHATTQLNLGITFFNFVGQKGSGPEHQNQMSHRPNGQIRGINISTELKRAHTGIKIRENTIHVDEMEVGDIIGREVGFGPLPPLGAATEGLGLRPVPFEGVARYSFHTKSGETIGAIVTSITEGRRFDIRFDKAPDKVGFRFGFFGPLVYGTGCFHGAQGLFYGASASFLSPPPGEHVVTHFYAAMLDDPSGKHRA
ncbi:MAG: hypothetical protein ABL921_04570 [Pirellula sp.]